MRTLLPLLTLTAGLVGSAHLWGIAVQDGFGLGGFGVFPATAPPTFLFDEDAALGREEAARASLAVSDPPLPGPGRIRDWSPTHRHPPPRTRRRGSGSGLHRHSGEVLNIFRNTAIAAPSCHRLLPRGEISGAAKKQQMASFCNCYRWFLGEMLLDNKACYRQATPPNLGPITQNGVPQLLSVVLSRVSA